MELPSWLKPANTLSALSHGAAAGDAIAKNALTAQGQANQLAIASQQVQAHMAETKMETDARKEISQQQAIKQSQEAEVEGAYKQQQLELAQAHLKNQSDAAAMEAAKSARTFADQQGLAKDVQGGMPVEKAIYNRPGMLTPGVMANVTHAQKPEPTLSPLDIQDYRDAALRKRQFNKAIAEKSGDMTTGEMADAKKGVAVADADIARIRDKQNKAMTSTGTNKVRVPNAAAIDHLQKNPDLASQFNDYYGAGSADKVLGQKQAEALFKTPRIYMGDNPDNAAVPSPADFNE